MNDSIAKEICYMKFNKYPDEVKRFQVGLGNYVYKISFGQDVYVLRITENKNTYKHTIYWLNKLRNLEIPIPRVLYAGEFNCFSYMVLNYIPGEDLGNVYAYLSDGEKKLLAKGIINIQNKVASLPENQGYGYLSSYEDGNYKKSWKEVILQHLDRSRSRIKENKVFDFEKVDKIEKLLENYDDYFSFIKPIPFLDDITTKNVLIDKGRLSGIIDIDWLCFGDKLYNIALTNMALISLGYDTRYIDYLMEEVNASEIEKEILKLYTIIFCVDFMSEIGMKFNREEPIELNKNEVLRFNELYENMYKRF